MVSFALAEWKEHFSPISLIFLFQLFTCEEQAGQHFRKPKMKSKTVMLKLEMERNTKNYFIFSLMPSVISSLIQESFALLVIQIFLSAYYYTINFLSYINSLFYDKQFIL